MQRRQPQRTSPGSNQATVQPPLGLLTTGKDRGVGFPTLGLRAYCRQMPGQ